jgi:hypothetical protein
MGVWTHSSLFTSVGLFSVEGVFWALVVVFIFYALLHAFMVVVYLH